MVNEGTYHNKVNLDLREASSTASPQEFLSKGPANKEAGQRQCLDLLHALSLRFRTGAFYNCAAEHTQLDNFLESLPAG